MKLYSISYPGLWMGGLMIIKADSKQNALDIGLAFCPILQKDYVTDPTKITVTKIKKSNIIVYYGNGDY